MGSRFYGDVQLGFTPSFMDRALTFTLGVINVFNTDPPKCDTCTGPNYDPTTYDVPGQFGYLRVRSEEHTSELKSLMRISYAVFCLNKKHIYIPLPQQ